MVSRLYPEIALIGVATRRSALRDCSALGRVVTSADQLAELVADLRGSERRWLLLIDDADVVDDPARALTDLFGTPRGNLHAIVAGRTDALKSLGHWSVGVRRSRNGLLLQPDVQVDGPLARAPRSALELARRLPLTLVGLNVEPGQALPHALQPLENAPSTPLLLLPGQR